MEKTNESVQPDESHAPSYWEGYVSGENNNTLMTEEDPYGNPIIQDTEEDSTSDTNEE